jgi:uncharacterized protein (DUF305 family)
MATTGGTAEAEPGPTPPARSRARTGPAVVVGAVLVVGALVWGVVLGVTASRGPERDPGDASVDAGFARDLSVLQRQAVGLAEQQANRTTDESTRRLATSIGLAAEARIGRMRGWLDQWDLSPTSTRTPLAWQGHTEDMPGMDMSSVSSIPGMASALELNRFGRATGGPGDVLFLQLLVRHHQGDIALASSILRLTDRSEVRSLARSLVATERREINAMTSELRRRDAIPLPPAVLMTSTTAVADPSPAEAPAVVARVLPFVLALAAVAWLATDGRRGRRGRARRGTGSPARG